MHDNEGGVFLIRAIIADDEIMVCELISRLIDWEAFGITIIEKVFDGNTALERILEEKPEIVITDIRMPPFDGIELIRRTREAGLDTRFIVVSGHRQFEYARSALKYDVRDYLLKPINREELQNALCKITRELQQEQQRQSNLENLQTRIRTNTHKIRQQFLFDLIAGRFDPRSTDLPSFNETYHYGLHDAPLGLFIIKADCCKADDMHCLPLAFERVLAIARRTLLSVCTCAETAQVGSRLYCFFQIPAAKLQKVSNLYQTIADELASVLLDFESFSFTVCPANPVSTLAELPQALQEAERSVYYRIIHTQLHISQYLSAQCHRINFDSVFSAAQQDVFLSVLRTGERAKIDNSLRGIFSPFLSHLLDRAEPNVIYDLCACILTLIKTHPDCAGLDYSQVEWACDNAVSVPSLVNSFIKYTLEAIQPYFNSIMTQNIRPIQLAIEYINEHYGDPLSLEMVAEYVHLTPPYFSQLFKKETGSTFIDYLTLQRMNQAKRLLRHSDLSVSEIVEQTGYSDAKYFSRVFTKSFGISPQKYRKL